MLNKCLVIIVLLFVTPATSQMLRPPVSVPYTKITAYSNQFKDAFSFSGNLGTLGKEQVFAAGLYSEKRFFLKELTSCTAVVTIPTASGNFGWTGSYLGSALFNQSAMGLAYGRELGSNVSLGVQFTYSSQQAVGYGKAAALAADAGALIQLSPQLNAGIQVQNLAANNFGKEGDEKLAPVFTAGLGYDVSEKVFIGAEAEKTEDLPFTINAGLHYRVAEKLNVRTGVSTATSVYYLGFGVHLKNLRIDVTVSVHPYLGTTPGLLLLYSAKK